MGQTVLVPLFAHHVPHVIDVRTEEQMRGIDATTIVAAMQDEEAVGNRAMRQLPRDAMCANHRPVAATSPDLTVPVSGERTRPEPATSVITGFLDMARKALSEWRTFSGSHDDLLDRVVRAVTVLLTSWRPAYFIS